MSDIRDIVKMIVHVITKETKSSSFKRGLGEYVAGLIKTRTRSGHGEEGGRETRLAPLKASTIRRRGILKRQGLLSKETSPGRSNLTESGDMLNSITTKVTSTGLELSFKPAVKRRAGENQATRPFFGVTDKEKELVSVFIAKQIKASLKNRF